MIRRPLLRSGLAAVEIARRTRSHGVVTLVAVLVVVLAELLARTVPPDVVALERWPTDEHAVKHAQMEVLGDADVAVVGASHVVRAVDPVAMTEALGGRVLYNAGIPGSGLEENVRWTLDVVVPTLEPDVVVLGIGAEELDAAGRFQVERAAALGASPGFRHATGDTSPLTWLERHSALVARRMVVRRPWTSVRRWQDGDGVGTWRLGELGRWEYERDKPYRPGAVIAAFSMGVDQIGRRRGVLRDLVAELDARGVDVVVLEPPTEADVFAAAVASRVVFRDDLEEVATGAGARYVDLSAPPSREHLQDPVHLNRAGRAWFTPILVEALVPVLEESLDAR